MALTPIFPRTDTSYKKNTIVWFKPSSEIKVHVRQRYKVDEGVYNHPALIITCEYMCKPTMSTNEVDILLVCIIKQRQNYYWSFILQLTTLGGQDAEDHQSGQYCPQYLPIGLKQSRSGISQLSLVDGVQVRAKGHVSLRDRVRVDCGMLKAYDKGLPVWWYSLDGTSFNIIAPRVTLKSVSSAHDVTIKLWIASCKTSTKSSSITLPCYDSDSPSFTC